MSKVMPRLKMKRISVILVTVCLGYWLILYWTSFGLGPGRGAKRRFKHRGDGSVPVVMFGVEGEEDGGGRS
ncbi:hypothetical protein ACOMHN_052572 [Nucella lapillus]